MVTPGSGVNGGTVVGIESCGSGTGWTGVGVLFIVGMFPPVHWRVSNDGRPVRSWLNVPGSVYGFGRFVGRRVL